MARWVPLAECDDAFFASAPLNFVHTVDLEAPAERVWNALASDEALTGWSPLVSKAVWTSPRPFGVGTTREVAVGHGAAAVRERFYRWDENSRMTFTVDEASRPGFRRFGEDLVLTPNGTGTRLTWTFALEAHPALAPLLTLAKPLLHRATGGFVHGIADFVRGAREARKTSR